jgi:hypothetical protein
MHPHSFLVRALLSLLFTAPSALADVTVYGWEGAVATSTAAPANYTGLQAYNPVVLTPPPLPSPMPATTFNIAPAGAPPAGSSIKLNGSMTGFSIEFSVLTQVCEWSIIP